MQAKRIFMSDLGGRSKVHTATILAGVAATVQILFTAVSIVGVLGFGSLLHSLDLGFLVGFIGFSSIALGVVWSFIDYAIIYRQLRKDRFLAVSDIMLVAGVLQLAFGSTVPGVLLLLAWMMEQK